MKGAIGVRKAVGTPVVNDCSSTNILSASYTEIVTALTYGVSGIYACNTSSKPIKLATGLAGKEVDTGLVIPPGEVGIFLPMEFKAGQRITARAYGALANTGFLYLSFFQ